MFRNELLNLHSNSFRRERVGHAVRYAAKLDGLPTTFIEPFPVVECKKTVCLGFTPVYIDFSLSNVALEIFKESDPNSYLTKVH